VLVGEASHGTSEYYAWRAALTRRLVAECGFSFVAVEGDWPDCARVNRWVRHEDHEARSARDVLLEFDRWPTWMWANWEVLQFVEWLHEHNRDRGDHGVGFYGLDVYSLWDSLRVVEDYLREHRPDALDAARAAFRCFEPYGEDPQRYAWSTRLAPSDCQDAVVRLLVETRRNAAGISDGDRAFDALQNAEIVVGAERYYRAMVAADAESWNVRDVHMADTLDRLVEHHGDDCRAVVWEHNTHVGDARATPMSTAGMVNVGELVRDRHRDDGVVVVGCSGHRGEVVAASAWGATQRRMPVPPAPTGSHEALLHDVIGAPALLLFPERGGGPWLSARRGHRAIGVVYDPAHDALGNWVPTVMGTRYDALLSFDETTALHPLHEESPRFGEEQEAFPTGQ